MEGQQEICLLLDEDIWRTSNEPINLLTGDEGLPSYRSIQSQFIDDEPPKYDEIVFLTTFHVGDQQLQNNENTNNVTRAINQTEPVKYEPCCCKDTLKSYAIKVLLVVMTIFLFVLFMSKINKEW